MANQIQEKEDSVCVVCGKTFQRSSAYMPEKRRKTCMGKCRLIHWARKQEKEKK